LAQDRHGLMQPGAVRDGNVPPPDIGPGPDQGENGVGEGGHRAIMVTPSPAVQPPGFALRALAQARETVRSGDVVYGSDAARALGARYHAS
jgi:hypothetical protein